MKPLIGVIGYKDWNQFQLDTTSLSVANTNSIERAGGIPLIFPYTLDTSLLERLVTLVQGFLVPGGIDIDPENYHEAPSPELGKVDKDLDRFQFAVIERALTAKKPILALCRGSQVVNVALGGTLYQDIPSQIEGAANHRQGVHFYDTDHDVSFEPGSKFYKMFDGDIRVNSLHHQAIKEPGEDIVITGRSPDGIVEAAQHKFLPIDLIQWHPEFMMQRDNAMMPLFESFIQSCKTQ